MEEISEKDKEQLTQAKETKKEAEQLQIKANELYLEAAMLEQDENFVTDKKIQKAYKKNQQNAQKTELNAAEKYAEANKIQIDIYQKYIDNFWKYFGGDESILTNARLIEETSKEYFVRASTARDEAKRIDNQTEKFLKLSEAYEYELIGIEKLISAFNIYKNWPDIIEEDQDEGNIEYQISDTYIEDIPTISETDTLVVNEEPIYPEPLQQTFETENNVESETYTTDDSINIPYLQEEIQETEFTIPQKEIARTTPDGVEVNTDQVAKILRHIEESDTIYSLVDYVEGFDMASIQKFWDTYRGIEYEGEFPPQHLATAIDDSAGQTGEVISDFVPPKTEEIVQQISETKTKSEGDFAKASETEEEIGRVTEKIVPDPNSKIIYRVQIAANRAPLSQRVLQKIYNEKQAIAMVNEDGWYKYSIGEFDSFSEANEFKNSLGRDDAFVVAYRDAINVQYAEKIPSENSNKKVVVATVKEPESQLQENIIFVVQIAASRESMDESSIKNIYKGDLPVRYRFEENWHKYQVGHTNSYIEIKNIKNGVDVNGAFIVAYDGDMKLPLWKAIRQVHSTNNQVIFVLQIAASKTQLDDEKLRSIFNGNDHIVEIFEEGWYKYHIVCGNTYDSARRFKNLWGIKNSFIVAYKNNKKIDIRQAIQETSN